MIPYPHFPTRTCLELDGEWSFGFLGDVPFDAVAPASIRCTDVATVPGVWDTTEPLHGQRGVGVYQRVIRVPFTGTRRMRLRIGALSLRGRVWWDGQPRCDVSTPYSHADFDLDVDGSRPHVLTIAVDNRFDDARSPLFPTFNDFYAYGGIFRSVRMTELPARRIERVVVSTIDVPNGLVRLSIRLAAPGAQVRLRIAFNDSPAEEIVASDGEITLDRVVPDAKPWSPESPWLHTVRVEMDGDCIVERFGLRTIATRDRTLLLNGEPIRIKGVNRHEAHPQFGPVQSAQSILQDLQMIKDLGCNFVRLVHYPADPVVLDLCDRVGLLVWQESLAWGLDSATLGRSETCTQLLLQTVEMVREGINHPSIVIWAFLNECASDSSEGEQIYGALAGSIRAEDRSRLVSFASNRPDRDRCFRFADVVSVNLYPGWIWPQEWTIPTTQQIKPFLHEIAAMSTREDIAGKPMLLSEIGACGLYGVHDRDRAQWSEEAQADFMAESCRVALDDPRWCGIALWQFCDTRSFVGVGQVRTKPRGFNCAGLVDEYRRAKLAYDVVKAAFAPR